MDHPLYFFAILILPFLSLSEQINLRGLDGIQGPVYVGTGCVFNRTALYGYEPPVKPKHKKSGLLSSLCGGKRNKSSKSGKKSKDKKKSSKHVDPTVPIFSLEDIEEGVEGICVEFFSFLTKYISFGSPYLINPAHFFFFPFLGKSLMYTLHSNLFRVDFNYLALSFSYTIFYSGAGFDDEKSLLMSQMSLEKRFGQSAVFVASTLMENGGVPQSATPETLLKEAIHVISCGYEDKTEWGSEV